MVNRSVLHVTAGLHPSSGGPSRTVVQLTDSVASVPEFTVLLLSQTLAGEPSFPSSNPLVRRLVLDSSSFLAQKLGLPVHRELNSFAPSQLPALIHSHGVWHAVNHWASCFARRHNIPLVVQPRGMLEPWAMQHRVWKKRLGMALFQRRDLMTAKLLVATAQTEYENLRTLGLRQPIAIIPNGVQLLAADTPSESPGTASIVPRTALFLSRIHPKKGLFNLVDAWAQVKPTGWILQIAGPDEGGHLAAVLKRVERLGLKDTVQYVGEVDGAAKSALYRCADLFVLPTYSENFGVVVAEALAHGVPVITTYGAPWADLVTHGCGWWIDIGVAPLGNALREAMSLSDDERRAMGARAREYVRRYDWDTIAQQTAQVYRWVLDQGDKPECVVTD